MGRLSSEMLACYSTVQNHLSFRLLFTYVKIKVAYGTVVLLVVLKDCETETWPLVLREERRLRLFVKRVIKGYFWTSEGGSNGRIEKVVR
jgi:hypothetical protein